MGSLNHQAAVFICLASVLCASPATADRKAELIETLKRSGAHAFEDERREVEIDGCQMTTYRWRDRPDHGWVLWTSFQFDMAVAVLDKDTRFANKMHVYVKLRDGPPEIGFALYAFKMREGTLTRQERPIQRDPSGETEPSPRGDGTSHYYEWRDNMIVSITGPDVEEKAQTFTNSYNTYVKDYCTYTS